MTNHPPLKAYPNIQGRCPACRGDSLFIGSGGYVTCSRLDCPNPSAADQLLHRLRPTAALSEHLAETIDEAFSDHYQPGVGLDTAAMTAAVLGALTDHLDIGDAEAWCRTCRRVWDGKHHRCESDAEQRVARVHAALASFDDRGVMRIGYSNFDIPTAGEVLTAVRATLEEPDDCPRTTPDNSPTSSDTPDNSALHSLIRQAIHDADDHSCQEQDGVDYDRLTAAALDTIRPLGKFLGDIHRNAESDLSRVIALYERWLQAGAPPLGVSINRWWDRQLIELRRAIVAEPASDAGPSVAECVKADRAWDVQKGGE